MSDIERCRNRLLPPGRHKVAIARAALAPSRRFPGTQVREFVFTNARGEISRTISTCPKIGTDAHQFVESLFGHAIEANDDIDYALLVGRRYEIVVSKTGDGPSLITSVKLIAD